MGGLVGLAVGSPLVFVALFLAIVGGGIVAAVLLLPRKRRWKENIPFGPFLSLGAMATLFFGENILNWYLKLLLVTAYHFIQPLYCLLYKIGIANMGIHFL